MLKTFSKYNSSDVCLLNDTAVTESFTRNLAKRYKIRNRQLEALSKIKKKKRKPNKNNGTLANWLTIAKYMSKNIYT